MSENSKGYRVLNPKVGVIYGDGINRVSIDRICRAMMDARFCVCPDNLVFGMGGGLLQQVNRDTLKWAFKCSAADVGGEWRDVYKQPITDTGKNSKRGRLKLVRVVGSHGSTYTTLPIDSDGDDVLQTVFQNGFIERRYTFDEVRKNTGMW
jgi:nicotinamide phosphoribosyltransferase